MTDDDDPDSDDATAAADAAAAFWALHQGLPRQAPGSAETTRLLLALARPLPDVPRVLDIGCGPGRTSLLLAAEAGATVTAVDSYAPFLDELRIAAEARGLTGRIRSEVGRMEALGHDDGAFDVVWADGAAYVMGVDAALAAWRRLVAPGGGVVLTDCEWTTGEPSAAARAFWDEGYPAMRTTAANVTAFEAAGWQLVGLRALPDSDWWAEYYGPLDARLTAAAPSPTVDAVRREIALRREHGHEYGYTGYVLRPRRSSTVPRPVPNQAGRSARTGW